MSARVTISHAMALASFPDDAYMPWNPIRSQLIQWAMNRRDDTTAKALINYFLRQYSDFISEVHRSCRVEAASMESEHRQQTQQQQHHRRRHGEHHDQEGKTSWFQ